jgi:hypothetical protein
MLGGVSKTHTFDLQDELATAGLQKGPHQELCSSLASLLRPWLRDGRYGPIVDGPSNVDLGSVSTSGRLKVVHFELGEMGKSEADLKSVVGFLITNQVRNHIQSMPRGVRKQVILEEMTSFLKVPNGDEIVIDYYEPSANISLNSLELSGSVSTDTLTGLITVFLEAVHGYFSITLVAKRKITLMMIPVFFPLLLSRC